MKFEASAIVSCYNCEEFIRHKLENIFASSANIQIILIDCQNGKNLDQVDTRNHKIKIRIFRNRISLWKAMNIGIDMADSKYVVQANADDLVHKNAYRKQIDKLNKGFDISYFDYVVTSGYWKNWESAISCAYSSYNTPDKGYSTGNGLGMFPMWRKSLYKEVGAFNEDLEIFGDCIFWDKLTKAGKKFGRIPEKLGAYAQRKGENLESNKKLLEKDKMILKCQK